MTVTVIPKEGKRYVMTILVDDEPWRDIHLFVFGRNPKINIDTFDEIEYRKAKYYAVRQLAQKNISSFELRKKLKAYLVSDATIERTLEEFQKLGYTNDKAWLEGFVKRKLEAKCGPGVIKQKLFEKGVSREDSERALEQFADPNLQIDGINRLLQSKYRSRDLTDYKERQKVIAALLRKGYAFEDIMNSLEAL